MLHKYTFVDYDHNVHTQHVESYNTKVKSRTKLLMCVKKEYILNFLNEWSWLDNSKIVTFNKPLIYFYFFLIFLVSNIERNTVLDLYLCRQRQMFSNSFAFVIFPSYENYPIQYKT